ncbi:hypothetical protein SUGI_0378310 [Cryptomeria japonica]|nr:hypothetical protein SUGI_0378310 [Cryptomeria japonica]
MEAFEGSRSDGGSRSRDVDMRGLGIQAAKIPNQNKVASKIGSWSDEANIAFPIEVGRAQWGKDININILPNDFYMIEFMSNEVKWQAKNKGPYILDGIEVHIIEWQTNFNPQTHLLPDSKVWIRLYNCPSNYWHIDVIKDICKDLGTFVLVDDVLEDKIWGSFLRICICTNQITKIPEEVKIIGAEKFWIQKIDREDQLHIFPKCFSLDHIGLGCDVSATIQKSYSSPPSSDQSESQQDLLMLLEKTKTLHADIETKLANSLPSSPLETGSQLVIEDYKIHTQEKDATRNLGEMGDKVFSSLGIELEDGEIESSSSGWEEDFEPDSDLILEDSTKGFGKSDSTIDKPNFKPKGMWGHK